MNSIIKQKAYKNNSEEYYSTSSLKTNKLCVNMEKIKFISLKHLFLMLTLIPFAFIMKK